MGRPLNKKFFGAPTAGGSEIKVQFHNGTKSVNGYIVKQLGSKKFRCTDGVATTDCLLVDKAAGAIAAGEMSIVVKDDAGAVKQVTKIAGKRVTLDSGETIAWGFDSYNQVTGAVEMEEAGNAPVAVVAVTAVTSANPGAVTTGAPHLLETGDRVRFDGVVGMVELNAHPDTSSIYAVTKVNATSFTIGVNTTGFTTYVSGGTVTQVEADADVFEAD